MLTGYGLARRIHIALIGLLVIGVAGSFWMSMRARSTAEERAVEQAQVIADSSLTLVFRPDDLQHDASPERIRELADSIDDVVLDPSDFDTVTLFSSSGEILFSTEDGNIGQRLAGERPRIRDAFRGEPQSRLIDDTLSVLVGLRFPSGVGSAAAVELSRPADDITGAAAPWRTNMFFLGGALALVLLAAGAPMLRGGASVEATESSRMRVPVIPARQPVAPARRIEAPRPGMKEEAEARRRAETRAQEAEQRLNLLQDQYRATLEELQSTQRTMRDQPVGLGREFEERAVKAEQAARSLEQRLHSVTAERDRIAGELLARRDAIVGPGQEDQAGRSGGHGPSSRARGRTDAALDDDPGAGRLCNDRRSVRESFRRSWTPRSSNRSMRATPWMGCRESWGAPGPSWTTCEASCGRSGPRSSAPPSSPTSSGP